MGNLTAGEIINICIQLVHIVAHVYMHYNHLFTSSCCDGKCCLIQSAHVAPTEDGNKEGLS